MLFKYKTFALTCNDPKSSQANSTYKRNYDEDNPTENDNHIGYVMAPFMVLESMAALRKR